MFPSLHEVALLLAAQTEAPAPQSCADNSQLFLPVLMIGIFYVVWLMPARKERKAHQTMIDALMRGDEVITQSGLIGSIADMTDKIVTLEVAKNVKIRVLRSSVAKKLEETKVEQKADDKSDKAAAKESKPSKS